MLLRGGEKIIAIIAPAYISQFGDDVTPGKFKTALQVLGFSDVHEVAFGADVGAICRGASLCRKGCHRRTSISPDFLLSFLVHDGKEILPDHDRQYFSGTDTDGCHCPQGKTGASRCKGCICWSMCIQEAGSYAPHRPQ